MKPSSSVLLAVFATVLLVTVFEVASAQEAGPDQGVQRDPVSPITSVAEGIGLAASQPGGAGGTGNPVLGRDRRPLYRFNKSDVVEISFAFASEFNQTVTVQPDGFVVLRGAGTLLAEGLTVPELQQAITKAYSGFLHDPEITVTLKDFEKPYFLASGEVSRPGKYELRGDLTVNEAVAIAGGFTQQAKHSQVVLFRRISLDVAEAHLIDVKKMLNSRTLVEDWHLQPGDFIFVPQSRISKIRKFVPASAMNWYLNPLQF